jgi:AP-3 complex subunit delta-1
LMNAMGKADQRFRDELVLSVVNICMAERYALVTDFVWYLSVLADLIRVPCSSHGALIGEQIIDVCLRVEVIREAAVGILAPLLLDMSLLEQSNVNKTVPGALKAVAWVIGEYAHCVVDHEEILDAMLNPAVKQLPGETQAVYLQAIFKVYASAVLAYSQGIRPTGAVGALPAPEVEPLIELANGDAESGDAESAPAPGKLVPESEDLVTLREKVSRCVAPFTTSFNLEVRERSCQMQQMLAIVGEAESSNPGSGIAIIEAFATVLGEEIQPVSIKAQRKIEIPDDFASEEPMSAEWDYLLASSDEEEDDEYASKRSKKGKKSKKKDKASKELRDVTEIFGAKKTKEQIAKEERESREMLAKHKEKMGQYYLEGDSANGEEATQKSSKTIKTLPGPESATMLALENRLANHNVGQAERPTIKGESDSDEDEEELVVAGPRKGKHYDPKNDSMRLHGELGAFNPLKPLDRGEHLPAVEAYPRFDPYSKDDTFNAFAPQQHAGEKKSKDKKKKSKDKKKDKKDKPDDGATNGSTKEKKSKKEKNGGKVKSSSKDVDALSQTLLNAEV